MVFAQCRLGGVYCVETNTHPHQPVLLEQVINLLNPQKNDRYLDLTAGYGGHASAVLDSTWAWNQSTLVDRDKYAIDYLKNRFIEHKPQLINADMVSAITQLQAGKAQFDLVLADLGVSSVHLDTGDRGFSFQADAPLDMRMDQSSELDAGTVVNDWPESELTRILREYGEEPRARAIAQEIVRARPVKTTFELAEIVSRVYRRRGKKHPATKTFQAVRIAVNDELGQLRKALELLPSIVAPGGRIAIISFHSLEDRIVKQTFKDWTSKGIENEFTLLTKRPITADENEFNPRARSAKLRAVAKNKKKGDL